MAEHEWTYAVAAGVGRFMFDRPQARNALTYDMYFGLRDVCRAVPTDGSVRALIVSGAGGAFASGTDMAIFRDVRTADDAWRYEAEMEAVFDAIERCPVPTIAALDGACTGGGGVIAAACDLRIATRRLKFGFPIARTLGNALSAANLQRLTVLIGAGRVRELIFTARLIEAEEALAIGLVGELVDDGDALAARVGALAATLAGHAPLTLRATKEALRRLRTAVRVDDRDLIALANTSADFKEGMEAFLAKRPPAWRGH